MSAKLTFNASATNQAAIITFQTWQGVPQEKYPVLETFVRPGSEILLIQKTKTASPQSTSIATNIFATEAARQAHVTLVNSLCGVKSLYEDNFSGKSITDYIILNASSTQQTIEQDGVKFIVVWKFTGVVA
jgi:hypothetical protein